MRQEIIALLAPVTTASAYHEHQAEGYGARADNEPAYVQRRSSHWRRS